MKKRSYYNALDSGKTFLDAIWVPIAFAIAFSIFVAIAFGDANLITENVYFMYPYAMLTQVGFLLIYILRNRKTNFLKASAINFKLSWKNIIICLIIAVVGLFSFNLISLLVSNFLYSTGYVSSSSALFNTSTLGGLFLCLGLFAIIPAILEELIFRGIVYNGLKSNGAVKAIFISAIAFMLIHASAEQTIFPFIFGLVLAYVLFKTGNVIYAMIIHLTSNALTLILSYLNFSYSFDLPIWAVIMIAVSFMIIGLIVIYFLGKLLKKQEKTENEVVEILGNEIVKAKTWNAQMIVAIVLSIFFWVFNTLSCYGLFKI